MKKKYYIFLITIPTIGAIAIFNGTIFASKDQTPKNISSDSAIRYALPEIKDIAPEFYYEKFFVPVTDFSSLKENISNEELKNIFSGQRLGDFKKTYILEENIKELEGYFQNKLKAETVRDIDALLSKIKKEELALIPFDKLLPQLKAIKVDGQNIFDKSIEPDKLLYPKTKLYIEKKIGTTATSNRNEKNISQAVFTGVTAISRTVQKMIDMKNDPIYPARAVMSELSKADLTHTSSENSFFDDCPENPADSLMLCGKTASIKSLKAIGADIVDLNGNHQNDFGQEGFLESIKHLTENDLEYFGGGKDENDAAKILYKTINGTKLAFLSYAYFDSLNGKAYRNIADSHRAGVNFYSKEKVEKDIVEAKKNADFIIVDYQFTESYSYSPLPEQIGIFRKTVDLGADLIIGVQAHQPQKIEFYKNKAIFYGLGNFFFDQMWSEPTRQGIIPRLTFNSGKLMSIEIITTLLYDYSQPRITTGTEREDLLKEILPNP